MATIHVYTYGSQQAPYDTKRIAFTKIQTAINYADPGDTIIVHGMNHSTTPPTRLTYSEHLDIDKHLNLIGVPNEWPIIDGQQTGRVVKFEHDTGRSRIQNFEIINGLVSGNGGGIWVKESNVTIYNNCIHSNKTDEYGGGISVQVTSARQTVVIEENHIHANEGKWGGGIGFSDSDDRSSGRNLTIRKNVIGPGNAGHNGGGIYVYRGRVSIEENYIYKNRALTLAQPGRGGGIAIWQTRGWGFAYLYAPWGSLQSSQAFLDHNDIYCNHAEEDGGGLAVIWGGSADLRDNTIRNNRAEDDGGGLYMSVTTHTRFIGGNTIRNNVAKNNGGGMQVTCKSKVEFQGQNAVLDNVAEANDSGSGGGGISIRHAELYAQDLLALVNNKSEGWGGGLYVLEEDMAFAGISTGSLFEFCEMDNTVDLSGVLVESNDAKDEGGGICIRKTEGMIPAGTYSISKSVIRSNTSQNSPHAGIYVYADINSPGAGGFKPVFRNCLIEGHQANQSAVGIRVESTDVAGSITLIIERCIFTDNDIGLSISQCRKSAITKSSFKDQIIRSLELIRTGSEQTSVEENEFIGTQTGTGIHISRPSNAHVNHNNIEGHGQYGLFEDGQPGATDINAEENWWGNPAGPTEHNATVVTGDKITEFVDWEPVEAQQLTFTGTRLFNIQLPVLRNPPTIRFDMPSEYPEPLGCASQADDSCSYGS